MDVVTLAPWAIVMLALAVAAASIISSVTGMAGGILMFAAMNVFMPLRAVIAIHGVVQIFNNAARAWYLRAHLRWQMVACFSVGAVIAATLTTLLIANYSNETLPLMILAALIFYTLFRPKRAPSLRLSDKNFFWLGLATGSLGILAGAIDPLLAAFFMRDDFSREEVVANKSMLQFVTHLTKVPAFIYLGFAFSEHIFLILVFSLVAVLASRFGLYLLARINNQVFFKLMWWALLLAGIRVLYQLWQQSGF